MNGTRLDEQFLLWQFRASQAAQLDFLDDVIRLMADGIPLADTLDYLREASNQISAAVAAAMLRRLDEGSTMDYAMAGIFKRDVVGAVGAAQHAGDLAETGPAVLQRLRQQQEARKGAMGQLIKPALYMAFACALYAGFAIQVWPKFETVSGTENWPAIARQSYAVGSFFVNWGATAVVGLVVGGIGFTQLLRRWTGSGRRLLDRVWPFTLYRGLLAANALDQLGTLLTAGQDPRTALETLSEHAPPYGRMYIDRMRLRLDEGANLAEMLDVGFVAASDMSRLKLLSEYRNLRQTMALTGAAARSAILARIQRIAKALDSGGLAVVGLSFAVLILSVYQTANLMQATM